MLIQLFAVQITAALPLQVYAIISSNCAYFLGYICVALFLTISQVASKSESDMALFEASKRSNLVAAETALTKILELLEYLSETGFASRPTDYCPEITYNPPNYKTIPQYSLTKHNESLFGNVSPLDLEFAL